MCHDLAQDLVQNPDLDLDLDPDPDPIQGRIIVDMGGGKESIIGENGHIPEDLALDLVVGDVQDQNLVQEDLVLSVLGQDMGGDCPLMVVLVGAVIVMVVHVHQSTVVTVTARAMRNIANIEKNLPGYTLLRLKRQNG